MGKWCVALNQVFQFIAVERTSFVPIVNIEFNRQAALEGLYQPPGPDRLYRTCGASQRDGQAIVLATVGQ